MALKLSLVSIVEQSNLTATKPKEIPAQKIKRFKKELEDERLKNEILNTMIDISDGQYGTTI